MLSWPSSIDYDRQPRQETKDVIAVAIAIEQSTSPQHHSTVQEMLNRKHITKPQISRRGFAERCKLTGAVPAS
jgi:hypothetical protein